MSDLNIIELLSKMTGEELAQEQITPKLRFLAASVMIILGVRDADGQITDEENSKGEKILNQLMAHDGQSQKRVQAIITRIQMEHLYTQPKLLKILIAPFSEAEKFLLVCIGYKIAITDGTINQREQEYLEKIIQKQFYINWDNWNRYLQILEAGFKKSQITEFPLALYEIRILLNSIKISELEDNLKNIIDEIRNDLNLLITNIPERLENNQIKSTERTNSHKRSPKIG